MYVLGAVSILEGAIAELLVQRGVDTPERLHKLPFGALLDTVEKSQHQKEFAPQMQSLRMLQDYRNFIHVGKAAQNDDAYWGEIVTNEKPILQACDESIAWVASKCNDTPAAAAA